MKKYGYIFILLINCTGVCRTQDINEPIDSTVQEDRSAHFYFFPLVYWTEQTRLAGGIVGTYVFRFDETPITTRPSTLSSSLIYTQNEQIISALIFDHFWKDNRRRLTTEVQYIKYPDLFWGIGNKTLDSLSERYTPHTGVFSLSINRHITKGLFIGAAYEFDAFKVTSYEKEGFIDRLGYDDGKTRITSGLGITANWDTRNSTLYPTSGSYHQTSVIPFHAITGSQYDFVRFRFDLRRYISLHRNHIIAMQYYSQFMFGNAPINKYAELGSIFLMRGYYPGRFKDRQMMAFQAEYRMHVVWRFGLAAFAGAGDVSETLAKWNMRNLKYSRGLGLRFVLNRDNNLNLRFDLAYGNNSAFPVIAIGESF